MGFFHMPLNSIPSVLLLQEFVYWITYLYTSYNVLVSVGSNELVFFRHIGCDPVLED